MSVLSVERTRRLLKSLPGTRVLVLGDVMLDAFVWGRAARLSPEAPVPVVEVSHESYHLGGAANVAANVRALGGQVVLAGVIGDDDAGRRVQAALAEAGIESALGIAGDGRPTTLKTRVVAQHQQIVRADRERSDELDAASCQALLERLRQALAGCAALIVSDYQKGVVNAMLMARLLPWARRRGLPVLVDPKLRNFSLFKRVAVITPNQLEAEQATGLRIRDEASLHAAGMRILESLNCAAALITRGEHGLSLFERGRRPRHVPAAAREVFDVTGAGDTVIATLGLALGAGAPLASAALLANHAAGVVVGKLGTAAAQPAEVLAAVERAVAQ